jgi:hypothetical protein
VSARRVRCSETIASLLLLKKKVGREFQFFFDIDIAATGPCNLKPRQRDLTPVLRRPIEPAGGRAYSWDQLAKINGSLVQLYKQLVNILAGFVAVLPRQ